jgi:hypothetical protein
MSRCNRNSKSGSKTAFRTAEIITKAEFYKRFRSRPVRFHELKKYRLRYGESLFAEFRAGYSNRGKVEMGLRGLSLRIAAVRKAMRNLCGSQHLILCSVSFPKACPLTEIGQL